LCRVYNPPFLKSDQPFTLFSTNQPSLLFQKPSHPNERLSSNSTSSTGRLL
jgi:hypothetical protein